MSDKPTLYVTNFAGIAAHDKQEAIDCIERELETLTEE